MKLIVIGPSLSMGGVERATSNTLNGLVEMVKTDNLIFLSIFKRNFFFKIDDKIKVIEPENININKINLLKTIFYIRKNCLIQKRDNEKCKVLVFGKFYGAIVSLALIFTGIPIFISDRQSPLYKWGLKNKFFNKISYKLNPPQGVIAQTEIAATYQRKYFKKSKVVVIPNSVREVKLYPEIKREKVILAVGRLNDYLKGFDLLIESFAKLKNQDWELHIAGGDEEGEALKEQAERLGVINRIKFLGKVKEIDKCYAYAGMFVIPSRSEGFPNALAEAMTAGCCCVAFDFVAGPRDLIVNNENGCIVSNVDVFALANTIDELILNHHKRAMLGENAIEMRLKLKQSLIVEKIKLFMQNGM